MYEDEIPDVWICASCGKTEPTDDERSFWMRLVLSDWEWIDVCSDCYENACGELQEMGIGVERILSFF